VERVDHGVRCLEDPALVSRLMTSGTPLTVLRRAEGLDARRGRGFQVCPCSNHRLQVTRRFFSGENATREPRGNVEGLETEDASSTRVEGGTHCTAGESARVEVCRAGASCWTRA